MKSRFVVVVPGCLEFIFKEFCCPRQHGNEHLFCLLFPGPIGSPDWLLEVASSEAERPATRTNLERTMDPTDTPDPADLVKVASRHAARSIGPTVPYVPGQDDASSTSSFKLSPESSSSIRNNLLTP